ncbi:linker for activation of T-cells family member 2 isoform X2 [Dromaius novaehollandiae]|uniref:linker for activation of T-cells family member 2 isoform X2 n=1 Tax=Dromaius novaehollandiae TaxID=8790 RepID=UPI00311FAB74
MAQVEVLWAAASLMLLGAAVGACVRCQLSAIKREKKQSERRSQLENQQRFEVIRAHSMLATRRLEQIKEPENLLVTRKTNEELSAASCVGSGSRAESRYQNFLKEDHLQGDATYVDPISLDYYNCVKFPMPPNEKEEDSYSYQNVIVGASHSFDLVTDDTGDYENSAAIHTWKLQQVEESQDDEPDYVNTDPASGLAPLSKQSTSRKI